jgi:CheY-like chemotaxis protein
VRFGQVVTNLVSNAVKFTQDGEVTVRVQTERTDTDTTVLRVEVADTGIGIPAEVQPLLFESFTQADASTTREYGGSGLGLAICRRLVEALGGEIGFTSEVGVGTTFWFTAAFEDASAGRVATRPTRAPVRETALPASTTARGTVLVAEDNAVNQLVARGMLEGLGFAVEFAEDGHEAVTAVTSAPDRFVAVLMDCQMPRLDGYAATRAIREWEQRGARLPIIAMTASVVVGEEDRCLEAGMDDFLVKPVDFELLGSTLARWVDGTPLDHEAHRVTDDSGLLDLERITMLQEFGSDERSFFEQFVHTFQARVPHDVDAIRSAVQTGDFVRLAEAAHLLKGSAQNLGAAELGRVCQALEDAGREQNLSEAAELLGALEEQASGAVEALRALGVPGGLAV